VVTAWSVSAAPLHTSLAGDDLAPQARIVAIEGDVQVKVAGSDTWTPARTDQALRPQDLVRTHGGAEATLEFANGSRVDLRPDSLLRIADEPSRVTTLAGGSHRPNTRGGSLPRVDREADRPFEPTIVHKVKPSYPADAKAEGVEGLFKIDVVIDEEGKVRDARVVFSTPTPRPPDGSVATEPPPTLEGDPRLAKAALDAVRQWTWEPVVRDGKPVEVELTTVVSFRLK